MNVRALALIVIGCIALPAQHPDDRQLARLLEDSQTQHDAVAAILASGRSKLPLLISWAKEPPAGLNDLEIYVLNAGLADVFGELRAKEAIPFLIKNIGRQRFPLASGNIWSKPLGVIEEQMPAMTALIRIGPEAAEALVSASPWQMEPDSRLAAIIAVSEIGYAMKDPSVARKFLIGMRGQANNERFWAEEGLKHLNWRSEPGK